MGNKSEGVAVPVVGATEDDFQAFTGYPSSRVKVRIQYITHELAAEWLPLAEAGNRNKRPRRVETIALDMIAKRYRFTGVPVLFDDQGRILDARHRLAASVRAKTGFWALVVTGIDRVQAMPALDDVASRKNGDRLKIIYPDLENANAAAAICLILYQFAHPNKSSSWGQPPFQEVEKLFLRYRSDIEWVMSAIGAKIEPGGSSGGAPVLAPFVFTRSLDRVKIDKAAYAFKNGDGLSNNDPMRKLRQKVTTFDPKTKNRIGNKNSSSQFSRYSMSLYTLECLERVLIGVSPRTAPKADTEIVERLTKMMRTSDTAIKPPKSKALPEENAPL